MTADPSPPQQQPAISFQTDDWDFYRSLGILLLIGIFSAGGFYLKRHEWSDAMLCGGFFLLMVVGGYILMRRRGLGRRYVITPEGISSSCDGHPPETFLWRDVARVEQLRITVRTHDGRRISYWVPRTLDRPNPRESMQSS